MRRIRFSSMKYQWPVEKNNYKNTDQSWRLSLKIGTMHLPLFSTSTISKVQRPRGDSPQLCTVINGQLLKPSAESSSTRRPSKVELVPIGEVRKICRLPSGTDQIRMLRTNSSSVTYHDIWLWQKLLIAHVRENWFHSPCSDTHRCASESPHVHFVWMFYKERKRWAMFWFPEDHWPCDDTRIILMTDTLGGHCSPLLRLDVRKGPSFVGRKTHVGREELTRMTNWAASIMPKPKAWLTRLPTPLVFQSSAFRYFGFAVSTIKCCTSRQVRLRFASKAKAMMPAAIGADAEVPVWFSVHWLRRSVETTCFSSDAPLLYVDANVDEHASEYQGMLPFSVALDMDTV